MKQFRFIRRLKYGDWLEIINADSLEEAKDLYDFEIKDNIEIEELKSHKGCVLAFHICRGQAITKKTLKEHCVVSFIR